MPVVSPLMNQRLIGRPQTGFLSTHEATITKWQTGLDSYVIIAPGFVQFASRCESSIRRCIFPLPCLRLRETAQFSCKVSNKKRVATVTHFAEEVGSFRGARHTNVMPAIGCPSVTERCTQERRECLSSRHIFCAGERLEQTRAALCSSPDFPV